MWRNSPCQTGRGRDNLVQGAAMCQTLLKPSPVTSPGLASLEYAYSGLPLWAHCFPPSSRATMDQSPDALASAVAMSGGHRQAPCLSRYRRFWLVPLAPAQAPQAEGSQLSSSSFFSWRFLPFSSTDNVLTLASVMYSSHGNVLRHLALSDLQPKFRQRPANCEAHPRGVEEF